MNLFVTIGVLIAVANLATADISEVLQRDFLRGHAPNHQVLNNPYVSRQTANEGYEYPKPQPVFPACKQNEVVSQCDACALTCTEVVGRPNFVNDCYFIPCQVGCVCAEGFAENDDGKCIKESECQRPTEPPTTTDLPPVISQGYEYPKPQPVCGLDEVFDECSGHCSRTCNDLDQQQPCTLICTPGCICDDGFAKNDSGKCARISECQPKPTYLPTAQETLKSE